MKTLRNQIVMLGAITLALTTLPAQAEQITTAPDRLVTLSANRMSATALAQDHWRAIADGDVGKLMAGYGPDPILHWDGGAFDGDHHGTAAIQTVWSRFAQARAPLQMQISDVREARGAEGSRVVTAYAVFQNRVWSYQVVYRLVFREGQITEETWRLAQPGDGPSVNQPA